MAISAAGLGSGLDVTSIVSQLMELEQLPLTRLNQKEATVQAEISAYGVLKGGLSSLQSALDKLKDAETFQATKSSSSNTDVLTVSSDTDAISSSYYVTVDRLAQQHKLGSAEHASTATFGGNAGDKLTITVGTNDFELDLSTAMTLSEIQAAINIDSNETGVTAGLITGDSGNQTLVLTSGESGYENRVQLAFEGVDPNSLGFSMLNRDENDVLLASENELDASLIVDGVSLTRGSNSIDDVVSGLTLNLVDTGQSTISINANPSVASDAVKAFVSTYNSLQDQLDKLADYASSSVLRGVENQIRNVLNTGLSGLGSYSYISELGVTTNSDTGKLEFDSSMLVSALEDNPDSVISFFTDEDSGFAGKMDTMLEGYLQSGGTMDSIINGANSRVDGIERSRESLERRLEAIEQRYLKQFAALDTLMASMTTTSEYLTTQLDALSKISLNNNS